MSEGLAFAAIAAMALASGLFLKGAWKTGRRELLLAGWGAVAAAVALAVYGFGSGRGPFVAATVISLAVLALIAAGYERRTQNGRRSASLAPEPSERTSKAWRGWVRGFLAGPLGGVAATGCGIAFAVWMPGAAVTNLVLGGLLVPLIWAGCMAWTLADDRIGRAALVLSGLTIVSFAAAVLKGLA